MLPLPPAFIERMKLQLKDEAPAFLASLDGEPRLSLRGNPLMPHWEEAVREKVNGAVPWCPDGRYIRPDCRPSLMLAYFAGAFYLQESAAMAPVEVLDPRPGETVLDLCAAPGGKSTQILSRLRGAGALLSNEIDRKRSEILRRNIECMGFSNACVTCDTSDAVALALPEAFDAVLVDAPCSGEGMFRRDPASRAEWSENSPSGCAERQKGILDNAAKCLRPGGRMVFSTCTFNDIENEGSVESFLARNPGLSLCPFQLPGIDGSRGYARLWPHRDGCEGHFMALFVKAGDRKHPDYGFSTPREAEKLRKTFIDDIALLPDMPLEVVKGELCTHPLLPDLNDLHVVSRGTMLTETVGKTVRPSHALSRAARSFAGEAKLDLSRAVDYVSGMEVPCDVRDGWTLVTYDSFPLGIAKATGGVLKNHLPKGLRTNRFNE